MHATCLISLLNRAITLWEAGLKARQKVFFLNFQIFRFRLKTVYISLWEVKFKASGHFLLGL